MPAGVVLLGQVATRLPVLEVACNRCDRRGRLHTARLLAEHGPDLPMPELRLIIAADCPRMIAGHAHDICGVHFPGLIGLDLPEPTTCFRHLTISAQPVANAVGDVPPFVAA
jgi:hypothetical protein